ncbi:MAG: response regulator [Burkholderiales bacterium]|nr:response regulator transcription factor [Burkholderiales bacterium]
MEKRRPIRVYIVEDAEIVRRRLIDVVGETPHSEVIGFADTESTAIDGICQARPDLVIIDIQLRHGNGINVVHALKNMDLAPLPKMIVLTNYAFPQYQKKCEDSGADYFFDKSTEFSRISEVLESM